MEAWEKTLRDRLKGKAIAKGATGSDVQHWQARLFGKGFQLDVDGIFGPKTEHATRVAQAWAGVAVTGQVNLVTWDKVSAKTRTRHPVSTVKALLGRPKIIDARKGKAGFPRHAQRSWARRSTNQIVAQLWHHTGGPASFKADADFHVHSSYLTKGGAPAIAYCLGVDLDGTLFVFNEPTDVTWHCDGGHNTDTIGVAMRGNLEQAAPTRAQKATVTWLQAQLEAGTFRPFGETGWPKLRSTTTHRHVNATSCPGRFGEALMKALATRFVTRLP